MIFSKRKKQAQSAIDLGCSCVSATYALHVLINGAMVTEKLKPRKAMIQKLLARLRLNSLDIFSHSNCKIAISICMYVTMSPVNC